MLKKVARSRLPSVIFVGVLVVSGFIALGLKMMGFSLDSGFEGISQKREEQMAIADVPKKLNFDPDGKFVYEIDKPLNYIRKTEKENLGVGYPRVLLSLKDEQLLSFKCSPLYTPVGDVFEAYVRGVKQTLDSTNADYQIFLQKQRKVGQKMTYFQSCETEDGKKVFAYGVTLNTGNTLYYFGFSGTELDDLVVEAKDVVEGVCGQALAITKDHMLYYRCDAKGTGGALSSIYGIDFVGRSTKRLIGCESTSRGDGKSLNIKCSN